ncbi:unnamed protein product [Cunninghamella echinulata]
MYLLGLLAGCYLYSLVLGDVHTIALKSYKKNGSSVEHSMDGSKLLSATFPKTHSLASSNTPFIPLESDNNILWYAEIFVGSGKGRQSFTVDIDTGSSDLFIPGVDCQSYCANHAMFNPRLSPSAKMTNREFTLLFADKSMVRGYTYLETVEMGGLKAKNQVIGISNEYSKGMDKAMFSPDGLLGLGFASLSKYKAMPFLDTLYQQGEIDQKMFGIYLNTASDDPKERGELTLGGYNQRMVTQKPIFTPVTSPKYWQIKFNQVLLAGKALALNVEAIIDTGSTLIITDTEFAEDFYSKVPGAKKLDGKHYVVPCNNIPKLQFSIGKQVFTINPNSFSFGRVEGADDLCYGGVVGSMEGRQDPWIVGGVFLSSVYSIFDADNRQIGFSQLA